MSSSSRGRVVKALDSKSNGVSPRRFESCRLRNIFLPLDKQKTYKQTKQTNKINQQTNKQTNKQKNNKVSPRRFESCRLQNLFHFFLLSSLLWVISGQFGCCEYRTIYLEIWESQYWNSIHWNSLERWQSLQWKDCHRLCFLRNFFSSQFLQ